MRVRASALLISASFFSLLLFVSMAASAQTATETERYDLPARSSGPVLDRGKMLSSDEEIQLTRKLTAFTDTTSTAIVVVTMPHLSDVPISDYAVALERAWQVGQAPTDNGVVVLVSRDDRKLFISTGDGAKWALRDAVANRIVEHVMTPAFRQRQFYAGLNRGTDALIQATEGEFNVRDTASTASSNGLPMALIFTLLVLAYVVVTSFFRVGRRGVHNRASRRHGGMPVIIWGGGSRGNGFSGGGGGISGGGGKNFGGGGASGSW